MLCSCRGLWRIQGLESIDSQSSYSKMRGICKNNCLLQTINIMAFKHDSLHPSGWFCQHNWTALWVYLSEKDRQIDPCGLSWRVTRCRHSSGCWCGGSDLAREEKRRYVMTELSTTKKLGCNVDCTGGAMPMQDDKQFRVQNVKVIPSAALEQEACE